MDNTNWIYFQQPSALECIICQENTHKSYLYPLRMKVFFYMLPKSVSFVFLTAPVGPSHWKTCQYRNCQAQSQKRKVYFRKFIHILFIILCASISHSFILWNLKTGTFRSFRVYKHAGSWITIPQQNAFTALYFREVEGVLDKQQTKQKNLCLKVMWNK